MSTYLCRNCFVVEFRELLEKDYLLCISSAERFRTEAEQRAAEVAAAFTKLKEEVDTLKSTHASQIAKKLSMAPESPPATAQVIEPDEPPPAEDLDGDFGDDLENGKKKTVHYLN